MRETFRFVPGKYRTFLRNNISENSMKDRLLFVHKTKNLVNNVSNVINCQRKPHIFSAKSHR